MATGNQQSVCVAADNHWLRYCPSSVAKAHTNHIKKVVPEPRYPRPEHKSDTDCTQVQRHPGDIQRKGLDKNDENDRKGVETMKDVMNNHRTATDTNASAHNLHHERRSVQCPGQHKNTSVKSKGSGGNTSQDLESNCTKSEDKTTQRNRNMMKIFIPWKAQSDLNLNFSVECTIDGCNCTGSFDEQLSNMLLDEGLSDPTDIGSRVRNYKCSLPGCECFENEWKHFVPEDFALDSSSQKTEKEKDQPKDVGEMLTDKSDSDDSYEILEWDKTIADVTDFSGVAKQEKTCPKIVSDSELVSISNDLTDLEGYHTAPNSPASLAEDYYIIDGQANTTNHATVNVPDRCTDNGTELEKIKCTEKSKSEECIRCAKCNKPISEPKKSSSSQICTSKDSHRKQSGNHEGTIHMHMNQNDLKSIRQEIFGSHGKPLLNLEMPPFISASSINYEGNPATCEVDVVGRGSFGTVYKARFSDPMFSQLPIVVKECDEEFSNAKEITEEAQKLSYLQDTGYVPVCYGILCYGPVHHRKFGIVQEFVGTGLTLEQMMWDRFDLPAEYAFRIALQCCEGLARFHEKGILLNDIKSNNILLEFIPNSVQIKYIDFGLATDMRGKRYKNTKFLEDFFYLAPEVRVNGGTTSVASDIFSLGFMLEQLRKFSGLDELSLVARLFMDIDPTMRIPVRGAISLIIDQMTNLGLAG